MTAAVAEHPAERHDTRRAVRATVLSASVLLIPSVVGALNAGAGAPAVGKAAIVGSRDGSGPSGPIAGGAATTPFSLALPDGAACTGDSIEGEYRVQSFMVPQSVDPTTLTFEGMGPSQKGVGAAFRQPLYAVNTTAYANAATNLADKPGGPGTIINIPNFSLGVFKAGDVPAGRYALGVACTKGPASATQIDRLWATTLDVAVDGGAVTWTTEPAADDAAATGAPDGVATEAGAATDSGSDASDATGIDGDAVASTATDSSDVSDGASFGSQPSFNLPLVVSLRNVGPDGFSGPQLVILSLIVLALVRIGYVLSRAIVASRGLS